ncbi:MAG TPA: DUF3108 domain-containing protein [Xanthobacteraceae bacterium]
MTALVNRSAIRLAVVLAALLLDAGLNFAAAQAKLDATYRATLLGLPIGHISWTVELHNNKFTTAATGGISGLLRIFSDGHGDVSAQGNLAGGAPVASHFALTLVAGKWSDEVRILFHGNKAQEYVTATPAPGANQVPITDANRTGVLDPMTALLVHIPGVGKTAVPEACERTIPIFDGHTRYNLRLSFKRVDTVSTEGVYQGPVVVCDVKFFPVAGYDPKHFLITYLASRHDIEIWLAPITGSRLMVPYRMSMPTPMGLGILQATKFEAVPAKAQTTNLN